MFAFMAEETNDFPMRKIEQKLPQLNNESKTSAEMWQEFVDNTTLHGIRYVFMKRHILIRIFWLVLLLTSGGYYVFVVYGAIDKYYSRPINTVLSKQHLEEMEFPAVTICSLNLFAQSKILMTDDDPHFASSGLNITSCAVTSGVRGNIPCGLSLLCCCSLSSEEEVVAVPYCTKQFRRDLLDEMHKSGHRPDIEQIFQSYGQDIGAIVGPICKFGWERANCSAKDFAPEITPWGMCYTFNSGKDDKVITAETPGVPFGLTVSLDAQTYEYTYGKYSEGFKVLVYGQGEYFDQWEGINVGPGQHAVIALSQKRFKNLEKPYATNCSKRSLQTFSTYTSEGCIIECRAERTVKACKCRIPGYKDYLSIPVCTTYKDEMCIKEKVEASLHVKSCGCQVPCARIKYNTEVSYSKFPDRGTAKSLLSDGYTKDEQYQRNNLVLLQVGFKSFSYEMQEEKPAYDSISLFGEIGGNMGLFLGCSVITIYEFFDFVVSLLMARNRQTHPASNAFVTQNS